MHPAKRPRRRLGAAALALLVAALSSPPLVLVLAHVFSMYPVLIGVNPTTPPIVLGAPENPQAAATITGNGTEASVYVQGSNETQLLYNPGFSGPDGWYLLGYKNLSVGVVNDTANGAEDGAAVFNGTVPANSYAYAVIGQYVTIPPGTTNLTVYIVGRLNNDAVQDYLMYNYFGVLLYDPSTNKTVFNDYVQVTSSTYQTYSIQLGNYTPGKTYIFGVYYLVQQTPLSSLLYGDYPVSAYMDSVYLVASSANYVFSGAVLGANLTTQGTYYAELVLAYTDAGPGFNASLWLLGFDGSVSGSIVIRDGSVISDSTGWVSVPQAAQGYYSLYLEMNASKASPGNTTLQLFLVYRSDGGALVWYPVTLVYDPPRRVIRPLWVLWPRWLADELGGLDETLLARCLSAPGAPPVPRVRGHWPIHPYPSPPVSSPLPAPWRLKPLDIAPFVLRACTNRHR